MRAIDFFCGAGGVTYGFSQAGINVLGGIDVDLSCKETYEKNNNSKFLHSDIRDIKIESLQNDLGVRRNDNEMIFVGCSPCQYYTNLKTKKLKSEDGRMLLEDFQYFIGFYRPGYVFIENVPGFKKNGNSPVSRFIQFLSNNNYSVIDGVLNTKDYGIPQNRRRYVLLASRINNSMIFPKKDNFNKRTVRDAIGNNDIFIPVEAGYTDPSGFQHSVAKLEEINLLRIIKTPEDGGDRRAWENDSELQLDCYKNHKGHYDVYGRMSWDKPAPTLTTKFRYTSNGRYGHPDQNRAISIREGATLQSFPLDYHFYSDNYNDIGKMIGNAVPPKLARIIGTTIMENYNGAI